MEAGERCNLAACHNCGLVPGTACEEFNRLLDRALLVGSLSEPSLGFFAGVASLVKFTAERPNCEIRSQKIRSDHESVGDVLVRRN
jgi:hypothetical protein